VDTDVYVGSCWCVRSGVLLYLYLNSDLVMCVRVSVCVTWVVVCLVGCVCGYVCCVEFDVEVHASASTNVDVGAHVVVCGGVISDLGSNLCVCICLRVCAGVNWCDYDDVVDLW